MQKEIVEDALIRVGMPVGLRGFNYIVDTIMLLDKPEWQNPKWTSLYHCVAKMYGVTSSLVEASIRYALKSTRDRNIDYDSISYYIGYGNCENSNSLLLLFNRLKMDDNKRDISFAKMAIKDALIEFFS